MTLAKGQKLITKLGIAVLKILKNTEEDAIHIFWLGWQLVGLEHCETDDWGQQNMWSGVLYNKSLNAIASLVDFNLRPRAEQWKYNKSKERAAERETLNKMDKLDRKVEEKPAKGKQVHRPKLDAVLTD
ncbi:hypothetical protein BGX28_008658 [Mortierella sp. GBA30]|nr:hypothetical protein BGX28_008658 [Mortierella sp. GBA30]